MPSDFPFPLGFLHLRLDSGHVLSECLFYPDLTRLAANRERATEAIRHNLEVDLPQLAPGELYRRRLGTTATSRWVVLTLDPPRELEAWKEPVKLRFPVVV
jgi:hypothetical protein